MIKEKLKAGDQIVATEIAHYTHAGAEGKQSQWVGDLIMVNNPKMNGIVGGVGLHSNQPNRDRPCIGLGNSLHDGTYRMATPDDQGFIATREQWFTIKDQEISRLRAESFVWGFIAILSIGALALKVMP